jgi:catechol 2,3-dioxygenase-like lactoylglutathione lyase family enzyme
MSVSRIVTYPGGDDTPASRDFYVGVLGLEVSMEEPVVCLRSPANPSAQVILEPPGFEDPGGTIVNVLAHSVR